MADISKDIETILSSLEGATVRKSIANAIQGTKDSIKDTEPTKVQTVEIYTAVSADKTAPNDGYSTGIQEPTEQAPYLWGYVEIKTLEGESAADFKSNPVLLNSYVQDTQGEQPTGVKVFTVTTDEATTPSLEINGWSEGVTEPSAEKPYLYAYIETSFIDDNGEVSSYKSVPVYLSKYIEIPESKTITPKSISLLTALANSATVAPSGENAGWSTDSKNLGIGGKYLYGKVSTVFINEDEIEETIESPATLINSTPRVDLDELELKTVLTETNEEPDSIVGGWTTEYKTPTAEKPYLWVQIGGGVSVNSQASSGVWAKPTLLSVYTEPTESETITPKSLTVYTAFSTNRQPPDLSSDTWQTTITAPSSTSRSYMFQYIKAVFENNDGEEIEVNSEPFLSYESIQHKPILTFYERYLLTETNATPTVAAKSWDENRLEPTSDTPYLWIRIHIFVDGSERGYSNPILLATYEEPEPDKYITPVSVTAYTALSATNTAPELTADDWTTELKTASADFPYLFTYSKAVYKNEDDTETEISSNAVLISEYTEPEKPEKITPKSLTTYTALSASQSYPELTADDWTPYDKTVTSVNRYLYSYTKAVYDDDGTEIEVSSEPALIDSFATFKIDITGIQSQISANDSSVFSESDYDNFGDNDELPEPTKEKPYLWIRTYVHCTYNGEDKNAYSMPVLIKTYQEPETPAYETTTYETISEDVTTVTMQPKKYIIVENAVTSLTVSMGTDEGHAAYLRFTTSASGATVTLPDALKTPEDFEGFEAGKVYEISSVDGFASIQSWGA